MQSCEGLYTKGFKNGILEFVIAQITSLILFVGSVCFSRVQSALVGDKKALDRCRASRKVLKENCLPMGPHTNPFHLFSSAE